MAKHWIDGLLGQYLASHDLGQLREVEIDDAALAAAIAEAAEQHPEESKDELFARAAFRLIWKEHGVPKPEDSVKGSSAPEYVAGQRIVEIQQIAKKVAATDLPKIGEGLAGIAGKLEAGSAAAADRSEIETKALKDATLVIQAAIFSANKSLELRNAFFSTALYGLVKKLGLCIIGLLAVLVIVCALSLRAHAQLDGFRIINSSDATVKQWAGGIAKLKITGATCTDSSPSGTVTCAISGGSGSGDFVGPASATDNAVVRFDGTTGKLGQNSSVTIDDSGNIVGTSFTGSVAGNASTATALAANGTNCSAGTYARGVDASGNAENCSTDISGNSATTTALAANPTDCGSNLFANAIDAGGNLTCAALTLAGAQFANQGTTTTVLHGNGSGNPSWASVVNADIAAGTIDLTAKVTGILPVANGGTGAASGAIRKYAFGTPGSTATSVSGTDTALASFTVTGGDISTVNTQLEIEYCFQHTTNSTSTQYKFKYSTFAINLQSSTGAGVMCGFVRLVEITDASHQMFCQYDITNGTSSVAPTCDTTGNITAGSNQTAGLYVNAASNTDVYTLKFMNVTIITN